MADKLRQAGFTVGLPKEAGWYLAAVRTNDVHEYYHVLQLWYNPMATYKWWVGGGYVSDHAERYRWADNVKGFMPLPQIN